MLWFVILALTLVVVILICLLSLFLYFSSERMPDGLCPFADKEKTDFLLDDEDDVMWSQH